MDPRLSRSCSDALTWTAVQQAHPADAAARPRDGDGFGAGMVLRLLGRHQAWQLGLCVRAARSREAPLFSGKIGVVHRVQPDANGNATYAVEELSLEDAPSLQSRRCAREIVTILALSCAVRSRRLMRNPLARPIKRHAPMNA